MKTQANHQSADHKYHFKSINVNYDRINRHRNQFDTDTQSDVNFEMTPDARVKMALGLIPELSDFCTELFNSLDLGQDTHSALRFVPTLKTLNYLDVRSINNMISNEEDSHVLIENELMKVVLIHWAPGKISSIHGHPKGGCVFKVIYGSLEELRYTSDDSPELLARSTYRSGAIAYIDDSIAMHAVGNPFREHAISIHAYTKY
ncbi:cysteine dioxygenase [Marinigracilibium pacificum]|uniref:Cysteine dioxygenase n=1 Tax=Marinigracilibium pacificum TaxID=2729599 RepID=A0A848IXC4_9BACT|nr:cysteine dioxygenase family protein [Marinigracilibium pacificum]NMM47935.1 hypothetical protein [Marinigracilibium pacificum]